MKTKLPIAQNKYIRFCLELPSRVHINPSHFRKINWLPVESRVELCTSTTVFKYWKGIAPSYLNDIFMPSLNNYNTRSQMALDIPFCRATKGQKSMPLCFSSNGAILFIRILNIFYDGEIHTYIHTYIHT